MTWRGYIQILIKYFIKTEQLLEYFNQDWKLLVLALSEYF